MYLTNELLAHFSIRVRAERLLEEGEQDGDDYACFETFSEADEENYKKQHVLDGF
jgi:hypothetical protein